MTLSNTTMFIPRTGAPIGGLVDGRSLPTFR